MNDHIQLKRGSEKQEHKTTQDTGIMQMARVMGNQAAVLQFADWYAYGAANTLPHIHCYGGGFHLKDSKGDRYNMVQSNIKYPHVIYEAYEWIRNECAEVHRAPLLEALRGLFHDEYSAAEPRGDYEPYEEM